MRVVPDINVIISGLNFPGNERVVLESALRGRFELYMSPFILHEVDEVLVRKFGWVAIDRRTFLRCCRMWPLALIRLGA